MELVINNISKNYGSKKAVNNMSLTMTPGIYGILGPNGAGKSTLMKLLTDSITLSEGEILYNEVSISKMGEKYREVLGYMPQQQGMYGNFTLRRFLYYMGVLKGISKSSLKSEIEHVAKKVNLQEVLDKKLKTFSGGMKQRALIAQAIIGNPQILIFDEPTAGLDPMEWIRIRNLIAEIALERIVLIATHVVSDIEFIAKEIILISNGKIMQHQSPAQLLKSMNDKVYEVGVEENEISKLQELYKVGNVKKDENNQIWLRIISDTKPEMDKVVKVAPTLEDVYLYWFEQKEGEVC